MDGGASANHFLMQVQADLLGLPVIRPTCVESTALGAAYLAGLAVGYWKDWKNLYASRQTIFQPSIEPDERQSRLSGWHLAVKRALLS